MTNQVIPEAAVEAAQKVAFERYGSRPDAAYLRTILKAASPHMLAEPEAKLAAVNRLLDEKYKLWAAICGNTCSKDIAGVDHDAIADEVAAAIREAMSPTP